MSEPEKEPKRSWRLHLSTAVLLMILVGAWIGIQIKPIYWNDQIRYGWPFDFLVNCTEQPNWRSFVVSGYTIIWTDGFLDALLAGVTSILFAVFCEWLIRRREGRKT